LRKFIIIVVLILAVAAALLVPLAERNRLKGPEGLNRLLFFPAKFPDGNWNPQELSYVDVFFNSEDGTPLHGWYCPCDQPVAQLLILHGNAGNITHRAALLRWLQRANVAVFILDYRGYGKSSGAPSIDGAIMDSNAARAKFCELIDARPSDLMLLGESLGGAFAVAIAAESPPRALILQSTFSSLRDVAEVHYPAFASLVSPQTLNSLEQIRGYTGPLLQSHGENDRTIPYSLATKLFAAANEPKEFVSIPHADHNSPLEAAYQAQFLEFITGHSNPQ